MEQPPPYTSADFQADVQKQLVNTALAALSDAHLSWSQVAPFLEAARAVCRDDLRLNGHLALHGLEYAGADLVPTDEAYLSVSARDRVDQVEWLSQTYWLSDLALADRDPERVRSVIAAMERTLAKLRDWLAEQEIKPATESGPEAAE
jgi:hypothetical protein